MPEFSVQTTDLLLLITEDMLDPSLSDRIDLIDRDPADPGGLVGLVNVNITNIANITPVTAQRTSTDNNTPFASGVKADSGERRPTTACNQ